MTIAIDIGGTKTLVAAYDNDKIIEQIKFPSPKNYNLFIDTLVKTILLLTGKKSIKQIIIGCPGMVDRQNGVLKIIPNLGWQNKPIAKDLIATLGNAKIIIENDANLAALSEAHNLSNVQQKVIYITFSTGIGTGFVDNGYLVPELLDSEGGHLIFNHEGKMIDWESFAAGRIIVKKYGKKASELEDPKAWREISKNMAIGIVDCCAIFPANIVVIGGSVGTHFVKYAKYLNSAVEQLIKQSTMIKMPNIIRAKEPEEAVIKGCAILAKQHEQR